MQETSTYYGPVGTVSRAGSQNMGAGTNLTTAQADAAALCSPSAAARRLMVVFRLG